MSLLSLSQDMQRPQTPTKSAAVQMSGVGERRECNRRAHREQNQSVEARMSAQQALSDGINSYPNWDNRYTSCGSRGAAGRRGGERIQGVPAARVGELSRGAAPVGAYPWIWVQDLTSNRLLTPRPPRFRT